MPALPDKKRADRGLSIADLIKYMVPYTREKSRDCAIKQYAKKRTKGKMPAIVAMVADMDSRTPRAHRVTIIGLDPDVPKLVSQHKVKVDCDCEDHTFTWEYSLWTWGAANIKRCNGEPAGVRNPGNYPGTCKHVAAVLRQIKSHKD